jgi:squalene-hopene/tetraprenyl-beta-curcumene cyclase
LSGGVPDADDTAGAALALARLLMTAEERLERERALRAFDMEEFGRNTRAEDGARWLVDLQNADGGWPTFCRGWGHLPFDRSGCDLAAHAMRAIACWLERMWHARYRADRVFRKMGKGPPLIKRRFKAIDAGFEYLARHQRADGSWVPLWFGNQFAPNDENPTYGTARVLAAYRDLDKMNIEPARRGVAWLLSAQNTDGGWGGAVGVPSSIEETAIAVEVLVDAGPDAEAAVQRGLVWLVGRVEAGGLNDPTPIGFYFAKLWYFEKLYPIIFTVAALGRAHRKLAACREPAPLHRIP